jgi:Sec-independent protein secretion pathway component TatC
LKPRKIAALIVFLAAWPFWLYAIWDASLHGFFENQTAVQLMVLGGAVSMVAAALAELW